MSALKIAGEVWWRLSHRQGRRKFVSNRFLVFVLS